MVQAKLISKLHKLNINFDKFNESKKLLKDLNKLFRKIETFRNDHEYLVELTRRLVFLIAKLSRQVTLERHSHRYGYESS